MHLAYRTAGRPLGLQNRDQKSHLGVPDILGYVREYVTLNHLGLVDLSLKNI